MQPATRPPGPVRQPARRLAEHLDAGFHLGDILHGKQGFITLEDSLLEFQFRIHAAQPDQFLGHLDDGRLAVHERTRAVQTPHQRTQRTVTQRPSGQPVRHHV